MKNVAVQQVFYGFVFDVALTGLFDGQPRQVSALRTGGGRHAIHNVIVLLLGVVPVFAEGFVGPHNLGADFLDRLKVFIFEHRRDG
jgi:hypothetical protein